MRINEFAESQQSCPECGGPAFSNLLLAEKQDACYAKVKSRYKVWPSAYASGALVQCRKKGAANWGNKSEGVAEGLSKGNYNVGLEDIGKPVTVDGESGYVLLSIGYSSGNGKLTAHILQPDTGSKGTYDLETIGKGQQGVAERSEQINELSPETLKSYANKARAQVKASPGANPNSSHLPTDPKIANRARGAVKADNRLHGFGPAKKSTQGVAESQHSPVAQAITRRIMMQRTDLLAKYGPGYVGQAIDDVVDSVGDVEEIGSSDVSGWVRQVEHNLKNKLNRYDEPMNVGDALDEEHNPEYDDEAGMADNNLETLARAVEGIDDLIQSGDNLPEWCQEKIAVSKSMLVTVWDYMKSEEDRGATAELAEEFDLIESIVDRIAAQNRVDAELVWEDLESLSNDELYAFAVTSQLNEDWSKVNKKDRTDGMSQKAVNAYRREHPGSKLKTAVTTKPSKLKKGSKASKRRKSYCSRSKGQMNMHNISCAKTPDKAICKARRRWNC